MAAQMPQAIYGQESIEAQIVSACAETINTVQETIRTVQTAALDVRDSVAVLQELNARLRTEALQPGVEQILEHALIHGVALVHVFEAMGVYDPVPIELL
jgi:hypothetical protein